MDLRLAVYAALSRLIMSAAADLPNNYRADEEVCSSFWITETIKQGWIGNVLFHDRQTGRGGNTPGRT